MGLVRPLGALDSEAASPIRFSEDLGQSLSECIAGAGSDAVIEIAPGRYPGPLVITRSVTLKGAGDLTRISGWDRTTVIEVRLPPGETLVLESLLIEQGLGDKGGGIYLASGHLRLHNVQIQNCRSRGSGGGIHADGGEVDGTLVRAHDLEADQGGAVWAGGDASVTLRDAQILRTEARRGGAVVATGQSRMQFVGMTIHKSRATGPSGGQAIYVVGSAEGAPHLSLKRVRLADVPLGKPVVVDPEHPGHIGISECDMPRVVLDAPGVIDGGANRWR